MFPTIPMDEVRQYTERNAPGHPAFDPDILGAFQTTLPEVAYSTPAGVLFVTGDSGLTGGGRYYNVRRQLVCGRIVVVSRFNCMTTLKQANMALFLLGRGAS